MYNYKRLVQMIRVWSKSINSCVEYPCRNIDYCKATMDNSAEWMYCESIYNSGLEDIIKLP